MGEERGNRGSIRISRHKKKKGSTDVGLSKDIISKGGGVKDEDSRVSTKIILAVDGFCRKRQSTMLWKEDLWNVHHLVNLGEEGYFEEDLTEEELGRERGPFK